MELEQNTAAGAAAGGDLTQSEVGAARADTPAPTGTQSATGGTPGPLEEAADRAPELTAAGTLVLEGAESQAAAGAVNELRLVREKLNTLRTDVDMLKMTAENLAEHQRLHAERIGNCEAGAEATCERVGAVEAAVTGDATLEECGIEVAVCPRVRAALLLIAEHVQALGGECTVNLVRNTLDGVSAG